MTLAAPVATRTAIEWQIARVTAIRDETPRVKSFTVRLPNWVPHRAGQHYDLRLTAADGYQAQRSYSIASEPDRRGEIDLTVELVDDGEVSPYLHQVVVVGDEIEVRGPIGGYFVWEAALGGPLLLVGGGSGVVPLMSMLRHRAAARSDVPARLLYSARGPDEVIYASELDRLRVDGSGLDVRFTLTRQQPPGWTGYARRIDAEMLGEVVGDFGVAARVYICGPTRFVEVAADALSELGVPPAQLRTERFGPSGN
ncbi:MAG: ferredoxin reductase [Chloroflexota bacterium]|nr:ferredoxin reductase [Chloroflexota bacterium]